MKQDTSNRPPHAGRSAPIRARGRPSRIRDRFREPAGDGAGFLRAVALILALSAVSNGPAHAAPPNVLFISIDDMNGWIAPFNDGTRGKPVVATPNLQRLASRGVAFQNAHTPVPVCRPTRASILTGVYPRNHRSTIPQYSTREETLTGIASMTQHFRHHGYIALGGGKIYPPLADPGRHWDVYRPFERPANQKRNPDVVLSGLTGLHPRDGFDWGAVDYEHRDIADVQLTEWAIRVLQDEHDRPFFLGVGFHFPHLPWYLPSAYLERYPLDSVELPVVREDDLDDVPPEGRKIAWKSPRSKERDYEHSDHLKILAAGEWKRAVQAYSATSSFVDDQIGRILVALRDSRHADRTIVVVFADNGWHLGEKQRWRKMTLWEESTRIPLILSYPPELPAGRTVDSAVSLIDLYPTLLELAGLPRPDHELDGSSVLPLLAEGGASNDRFAMTVWGRGNVAVRDARWRYIRYSKGGEELYDHENDPMEHTNLLARPDAERHTERVAHFNRLIDRYHPRNP